jgi:hypothetical protein
MRLLVIDHKKQQTVMGLKIGWFDEVSKCTIDLNVLSSHQLWELAEQAAEYYSRPVSVVADYELTSTWLSKHLFDEYIELIRKEVK